MTYEIQADKLGKPYLKKNETSNFYRHRGLWVEIGRVGDRDIGQLVRINEQNGLLILPDQDGVYRALVLFN